ncbi:MAG: hypothetical protein JWN44_3772 [Myxococcales bacterium]|nr:hypothetical protein [Myxococcales bacterium]
MTTRARDAFIASLTDMLQWRLLVAWIIVLLVPTVVLWLPVSALLGQAFDWSPRSGELARQFDMLAFEDLSTALRHGAAPVRAASVAALLLTLLSSPLTAGLMVTASRHTERPLGFVALLAGALTWYGRMFRVLLVSLVPLTIVGGISAAAFKMASKHGEKAILESQAYRALYVALVVSLVVFVVLHATVEAARAQMAADERLRSGWRAWWRGMRLLGRRPAGLLGLYLGPTLLSSIVAALFLIVRIRIVGSSGLRFWLAFVITQLAVAAIGWGRAARLASLTALARETSVPVARPIAAATAPTPMAPPAAPAN